MTKKQIIDEVYARLASHPIYKHLDYTTVERITSLLIGYKFGIRIGINKSLIIKNKIDLSFRNQMSRFNTYNTKEPIVYEKKKYQNQYRFQFNLPIDNIFPED